MDNGYALGIDEFNFIRINEYFNYAYYKYCIHEILYQTPLSSATLFDDYEQVNKCLKRIKENYKQITFKNFNLIQGILDKVDFNEKDYIDNLKVFELYAKEVKESD